MDHDLVLEFLANTFTSLPESLISVSDDRGVYAKYAAPTERYGHGILGDRIEAGQLVVHHKGSTFVHTLAEEFVYEDLRPRLIDVDADGDVEIVTIRTHVDEGAGIMIYKIERDDLVEFAWVDEIGTPSRWLNIAAIYDLDSDGATELAWIETPHIGGILKVARIRSGLLTVLAEGGQFSNHAIGQRNLCLSLVSATEEGVTLFVPTQDRQQIAGFQFADDTLLRTQTIDQTVDFSQPLFSQHGFADMVQGGDCTRP